MLDIRPHVQILALEGQAADEVAGEYLAAIDVLPEDLLAVRRRRDATGTVVAVSVIHQDRPRYARAREVLRPCPPSRELERPPAGRLSRKQRRHQERELMLRALAGV